MRCLVPALGKVPKNYCVNIQHKIQAQQTPQLRSKLHELEHRYAQQQSAVKLLADFNQRADLSLETADELRSIPR